MRCISVYMFNDLCPSLQAEINFDSQERNPIDGNDACHWLFGTCARRHHKEFNDFLAIQDPARPVTSRKTHPNWKVQPLLKHAIMVSKVAIVLGKELLMDEKTIGCKGRHPDILWITYKKEGVTSSVMYCAQMTTHSAFNSAVNRLQSTSLIR